MPPSLCLPVLCYYVLPVYPYYCTFSVTPSGCAYLSAYSLVEDDVVIICSVQVAFLLYLETLLTLPSGCLESVLSWSSCCLGGWEAAFLPCFQGLSGTRPVLYSACYGGVCLLQEQIIVPSGWAVFSSVLLLSWEVHFWSYCSSHCSGEEQPDGLCSPVCMPTPSGHHLGLPVTYSLCSPGRRR
jgi:hypothetical protein